MLVLPIKKKWFDMIKSGEKKEEYREYNDYYESRFYHLKEKEIIINKQYSIYIESIRYVLFRNGYRKDSPTIKCEVEISLGYGKEEWGAEPNKLYYVLKILSVEEVK